MAGKISKETIDQINSTVDFVAIVGEYTRLERRGGNDWWGRCPFPDHKEKSPSFHVDGDKKFCKCFGCQKGGSVINFMMEMEHTTFYETILNLAKRTGIEVRYEDGYQPADNHEKEDKTQEYIDLYDRTATMFNYLLLETDSGKTALDYVTKRGLTRETIEKFKLGYAPADGNWLKKFLRQKNYSDEFLKSSGLFSKEYPDYSFFIDRLMFPIFNRNGHVVAFSGRALDPKYEKKMKYKNSSDLPFYKKGETLFAFNFARNAIRKEKKAVICEGNVDVIAYHQCGIEYAVAPLGVAFTETQAKMLLGFVDTVYLSFDSDEAGQKETMKAILMCRKFGFEVKVIQIKGGKDPADVMLNFGAEKLTAQVNSAILDIDYLLIRLGVNYPLNTPDGKFKATREFFNYVDVLQSDIQQESSLERMCQAFNLRLEAVKSDFLKWKKDKKNDSYQPKNEKVENTVSIKLDAELRGLLAVTADLGQFQLYHSYLSENDFKNPAAKGLFKILEECFNENVLSIPNILTSCNDESMSRLITEVISSGVYQSQDIGIIINDTIKFIKRNSLEEQRNKIVQQIHNYMVVTEDDQKQLNALLLEKMELDRKVQQLLKGDYFYGRN